MKLLVPTLVALGLSSAVWGTLPGVAADGDSRLAVRIVERRADGSRAPVAARVHLVGPSGDPILPGALPTWSDHFVCDGGFELAVAAGEHRWTIERGPEYRSATGTTRTLVGETREVEVVLERRIDLSARGWWSGDTHIHRPVEHVPLLVRAEDLHVAPVLTVWNRTSLWRTRSLPERLVEELEPGRFVHWLSAEDERGGGALLFHRLARPLDLRDHRREYPSPTATRQAALAQAATIVEVEKPFWLDAPTWVASGRVDVIGVANNHMCRSTMLDNEAWGRPRDRRRLPGPHGNGLWTQEIWYRLLDCGFRLPPTAGSASGVLPNPVGYNRVYVHLDGELSPDAWWRGLLAGRSFVTNGPILLARVNGALPGETLRSAPGEPLEVEVDALVDGDDPIARVEVIARGEVVAAFDGDRRGAWLRERVRIERSGWLVVRTIAAVPETFRFASTAPFWTELGGRPAQPDRDDVDFFLEWIDERTRMLEADEGGHLEGLSAAERASVLEPHRQARRRFEALRALTGE